MWGISEPAEGMIRLEEEGEDEMGPNE